MTHRLKPSYRWIYAKERRVAGERDTFTFQCIVALIAMAIFNQPESPAVQIDKEKAIEIHCGTLFSLRKEF